MCCRWRKRLRIFKDVSRSISSQRQHRDSVRSDFPELPTLCPCAGLGPLTPLFILSPHFSFHFFLEQGQTHWPLPCSEERIPKCYVPGLRERRPCRWTWGCFFSCSSSSLSAGWHQGEKLGTSVRRCHSIQGLSFRELAASSTVHGGRGKGGGPQNACPCFPVSQWTSTLWNI